MGDVVLSTKCELSSTVSADLLPISKLINHTIKPYLLALNHRAW